MSGTIDALDRLEDLLATGRRIPLTSTIVVDEESVLELVDQARLQLPDDLTEATHIIEERHRLVEEAEHAAEELLQGAHREAEAIVTAATQRAEQLVANHVILQDAEKRASELLTTAEAEAARVTTDADGYAREVLERLDADLERLGATVRKGLEALPMSAPSQRRRGRRGAS